MIDRQYVEKLYNSILKINTKELYKHEKGAMQIIVSAPHMTSHIHNGELKYGEENTGVLIDFLKDTDVHLICKTRRDSEDPNSAEPSIYKNDLIDIIADNNIKCLVDLHGMSKTRPQAICISTNYGKNIYNVWEMVDICKNEFKSKNIDWITIDDPFHAKEGTVSETISKRCKIPAIQFEINSYLFDYTDERCNVEGLISAMKSIILKFGGKIDDWLDRI